MKVTGFVNVTCVLLVAALVGANAYAGGRPDSSSRDWFGHINGGYTFATSTPVPQVTSSTMTGQLAGALFTGHLPGPPA
jgi:hypothetical protein